MAFQIAIDGPVGSGKSSVGKLLAQKLEMIYLDTGAMYRCYALNAQRLKLDINEEVDQVKLVQNTKISFDKHMHIYLNDEDVTDYIRTPIISNLASLVSQYKVIREAAVDRQREIAYGKNVVMDGRDIGSVVLPNAQLKIYLIASNETRAQRRISELQKRNIDFDPEIVRAQIIERDLRDLNRVESPLIKCKDAIEIDTDKLTIPEVVDQIIKLAKKRM